MFVLRHTCYIGTWASIPRHLKDLCLEKGPLSSTDSINLIRLTTNGCTKAGIVFK